MSKITRHDMRITIVRALVTIDLQKLSELNNQDLKEILAYAFDCNQEVEELYQNYLDSFNEMIDIISSILNNLEAVDSLIKEKLVGYTIERLNYTDRAIVRLATYEFLYTSTPKNIIIDEAILITKEYSNLDDGLQSRFNNRLLNDICEGKTK